MEFKPKRLEPEKLLVTKERQLEIKLETLMDILERQLYSAEYFSIMEQLREESEIKIGGEHLRMKGEKLKWELKK